MNAFGRRILIRRDIFARTSVDSEIIESRCLVTSDRLVDPCTCVSRVYRMTLIQMAMCCYILNVQGFSIPTQRSCGWWWITRGAVCITTVLLMPKSRSVTSSPPAGVLQDLFFLLFSWVGLHGALPAGLVTPLACELLGLLVGGSTNGPVDLAKDVGFDC